MTGRSPRIPLLNPLQVPRSPAAHHEALGDHPTAHTELPKGTVRRRDAHRSRLATCQRPAAWALGRGIPPAVTLTGSGHRRWATPRNAMKTAGQPPTIHPSRPHRSRPWAIPGVCGSRGFQRDPLRSNAHNPVRCRRQHRKIPDLVGKKGAGTASGVNRLRLPHTTSDPVWVRSP